MVWSASRPARRRTAASSADRSRRLPALEDATRHGGNTRIEGDLTECLDSRELTDFGAVADTRSDDHEPESTIRHLSQPLRMGMRVQRRCSVALDHENRPCHIDGASRPGDPGSTVRRPRSTTASPPSTPFPRPPQRRDENPPYRRNSRKRAPGGHPVGIAGGVAAGWSDRSDGWRRTGTTTRVSTSARIVLRGLPRPGRPPRPSAERPSGHDVARRHESVVTPGPPFSESTPTSVIAESRPESWPWPWPWRWRWPGGVPD